jgi:hypothetical protein
MMISCGAALFTARLALRSLGYIPEACVLPDPGRPLLVARVSWQRQAAATECEQRLFSQVLVRRTHRRGFGPLPLGRRWGVARSSPSAASRSAGLVCLLTTVGDRPVDWVSAGQALQRALLASATCGVAAALHSQPLERARLREFIRTQLGDGACPQLVLRLGTVIQTAVSVRRSPASVLFARGGEHLGISHG